MVSLWIGADVTRARHGERKRAPPRPAISGHGGDNDNLAEGSRVGLQSRFRCEVVPSSSSSSSSPPPSYLAFAASLFLFPRPLSLALSYSSLLTTPSCRPSARSVSFPLARHASEAGGRESWRECGSARHEKRLYSSAKSPRPDNENRCAFLRARFIVFQWRGSRTPPHLSPPPSPRTS